MQRHNVLADRSYGFQRLPVIETSLDGGRLEDVYVVKLDGSIANVDNCRCEAAHFS